MCQRCMDKTIEVARWEARFMTLLAAHERALRMIEDACERREH